MDVSGLSLWHWLRALVPAGIATLVMAVAAVPLLHVTRVAGWGPLPALVVTGLVAGSAYIIVLGVLAPVSLWRSLWVVVELVRRRVLGFGGGC
jgi:hypothetical protein